MAKLTQHAPMVTRNRAMQFTRIALMTSVAAVSSAQMTLAQEAANEDSESKTEVLLEPITIDGKADVLTGGVQLDAEAIERQNPQTLRDVFRQEPGVTVGSPITISQKIYVNGIEDTNLAVDIDGSRQANKTYHHVGTTIVDPGILKAVKVETGVAPADAGPGALAGSISLETKDGRDLVDPDETFGGFAKLTYNSNTRGLSEDIAAGFLLGGFDVLAYATHEGGDAYEDGDGNTIDGTDPAAENYLFKVGYTADNGYRLKLSANSFNDIERRSARPNFGLAVTSVAPTEYRRENYTVSFGDETPTDMWDPLLTFSYTNTELRVDVPVPPTFTGTTRIHADVETINGKAQNSFTTDFGSITTGVDFYRDNGKGGRDGFDGDETTEDFGIFVQGRFDVTEDVTIYGGASSAFAAVPLSEVGFQTAATTYDNLQTARSRNYKAGVVYETGPFSFDGNLFKTTIDNANNIASTNRGSTSDIESRGFNISALYDYGDGFVRSGFSSAKVRVDSAAPVSTSTHYLGILTGDSINLEAVHSFDDWGVRVGTTNEYYFTNNDTRDRTGASLGAYFVSNLFAEYETDAFGDWTFRADVRNLFDTLYADRANVGADSTNSVVSAFNEPGRTFLVSAKLEF